MHRRTGFTLIELLVSMRLISLILAILATAFSVGLQTFGKIKAVGDMADRERIACAVIRRDLAADHFEASIRLSDPAFQTRKQPPPGQPAEWPREGFFMIKQFGGSAVEGTTDNIPSFRSPGNGLGSHVMHMTVKLKGNRRENSFAARCSPVPLYTVPTTFFGPPNQNGDNRYQEAPANNQISYTSQWAEVCYFLVPQEDSTSGAKQQTVASPTGPAVPLYTLQRIVRVLIPHNGDLLNQVQLPFGNRQFYPEFSTRDATYLYFNTPSDVVDPAKRCVQFNTDPKDSDPWASAGLPTGVQYSGQGYQGVENTMVLSDVVSFTVQVVPLPQVPSSSVPFAYPVGVTPPAGDNFMDIPGAALPYVFDSSQPPPQGWPSAGGLLAIQINMRIWDFRTMQTRQVTIIQDM